MGVIGMNSIAELESIFEKYWEKEQSYVVMPNTIRARSYLAVITKDIKIEAVLDNNEKMDGTMHGGIPIRYAPEFLKDNRKKKILISSHYTEIAEQLEKIGYQKNVDYIDMHAFVSMWYWRKKQEIHLLDVHTAITTFCSLNCQNCNMFMNHYKSEQRKMEGLEEFKADFNALFQNVDYCYKISILGGEPLLNKELPQMLEWLYNTYHKKIGEITIVTNGTIMPRELLVDLFKKTDTKLSISDYTVGVMYGDKIEKLEELLLQKGIKFERNKEMKWKDFYFPREKQGACFSSVREHMLCCNPVFRGLNDKKFYYCHIVWSAVQAGLLREEKTDYVELEGISSQEEKKKLLEHDLGFIEGGYVSMCKFCGGCGVDNQSMIVAGVQE